MHRTVAFKFAGGIIRRLSEHRVHSGYGGSRPEEASTADAGVRSACMAPPADAFDQAASESAAERRRSKSASSDRGTSNSGGNSKQGGLSATDKISVAIVAAGMLIFAGFCVNAGISAAATRAAARTLHKALEEATRESRALLRNGANMRWLKGEFRPNLPITTGKTARHTLN